MNNEKNLIPYYRFPEFKNSGNWCKTELGAIADFYKGKGLAKSDIVPDGNNYCIHYGELFTKYSEVIELPKSKTNLNDGFRSKKNDVLMPTSDVTPNGLAKASCINMNDVLLGNDILITRTNDSEFSGEFLSRQIRHLEKDVLKFVTGSTVYHLYASGISKLKITYPRELAEQQKIAACLSSLDDVIAGYEEKLAALEQHKKGLMQNLFPQEGETKSKYRFPEFENDGDWVEKEFSDMFKIGNGKDYKHLSQGNIPVYGSGGLMLYVDKFLYNGESACIGRKGTIDKPMFLNGKFWTVDTLFYTYDFIDCLPKFIFYIFQNINWNNHNEAGGVPSLSKANIYKITYKFPPIAEQQKIVEVLSSVDKLILAEREKIDALKEHKKGLMQGLFPKIEI